MRRRNDIYFSYVYVAFLLAICCTLTIQAMWTPGSWISNIYVPDSETMYDSLVLIINNDVSFSQYLEREDARTIYFIYQPLYILIKSPIAFILTNVLILSIAIFCTYRAFKPFGYRAASLSALSLAINPYILISITGISKEIPLCALTSVLLLVIKRRDNLRIFLISLLCIIAYGVRPAYGVIIGFYFLPYLILTEAFIAIFQVLMPFTPFLFSLTFSALANNLPILRRMTAIQQGLDAGTELGRANLERATASLEIGGLASCADLAFRTFANVFSLIFRPSFMTEKNNMSLLGSSYWLYGLAISTSIIGTLIFFFKLFNKDETGTVSKANYEYIKNLAFSVIYLVPAISLSLIIQPRYLMPILPISMGVLGTFSLKSISKMVALLLLLAIFGYIYLTFYLGIEPVESVDLLYKPDFVLSP